MKREHKEELKRILDKYDDRIKEAEIRTREYEEQAIELIRAKREEMLTLVNDMATWKMGQLFNDRGNIWKVTDIRSCTTSLYCDIEVAYTVTAVNSMGKTLSEVYQTNLSDKDIAREKWQPITDRKDVYVLPSKILVKELKLIKENKTNFLYLVKDEKGMHYTMNYDMNLNIDAFDDRIFVIKRRTSGHVMSMGRHHVYIKYKGSRKLRCHFEAKNLQAVTQDNKELLGELVEALV